MVFSNKVSYIARVAINAEFAGLLPTQNPGNESKIPTLASPPYTGFGAVVDVGATEELVDVGTVVDGARVVAAGSLDVEDGNVVVSTPGDVVSDVELSEHDTNKIEHTTNVPRILCGYRRG